MPQALRGRIAANPVTLVDNAGMKIRFTKMQGAGNDFIVLDETRGSLGLNRTHYRFLADRRYGIGAERAPGNAARYRLCLRDPQRGWR